VRLRTGPPEQHKEEHAMGSGNKSTLSFFCFLKYLHQGYFILLVTRVCIRNVVSMPYFRLSFPSNDTVAFVWRTGFFRLLLVDGSISTVKLNLCLHPDPFPPVTNVSGLSKTLVNPIFTFISTSSLTFA
jgi:hypothetical protein